MGSLHDRIISYFVGSFYVEKHLKHVGAAMKAFLFGGTVENGKRKVCLLSFLKQLRRLPHEKKPRGKKSTIHMAVPVKTPTGIEWQD